MLKHYIQLSKPGIIAGNVFAGLGGFLFAAKGNVDITLLIASMIGLACIIASACAFNNVIDQDIDCVMKRTQKRVLITGAVSEKSALTYGTLIGAVGFATLFFFSSITAFWFGVFAWFAYVVIYSMYGKRTIYGTLLGTLSGAVPPVLGYTAVSDFVDFNTILIYLIYGIWQLPHSYAIAVFRGDDYKNADIPVLPLIQGMKRTRIIMGRHIFRVMLFTGLLAYLSMHLLSLVILLGVAGWWLYVCMVEYDADNTEKWGRKVFFLSLYFSVAINILMMLNHALITYVHF